MHARRLGRLAEVAQQGRRKNVLNQGGFTGTADTGYTHQALQGKFNRHVLQVVITRTFQNIRLLAEASVIDNVMIGFYRRETSSALASLLGLPAARAETGQLRARAEGVARRVNVRRLRDTKTAPAAATSSS